MDFAKLFRVSMVIFPFKDELPEVATANLATAARHPRVNRVLAVGAEAGPLSAILEETAAALTHQTATEVEVVIQERLGDRRPGKGDAMNTGLRRFLTSGADRLHFYDADIVNFDDSWIEGAERAADQDYPIVRHYFPRASTDAMITWMITRPGFALTHPGSIVWRIRQPLGGELLLTRPVVETLVSDPLVTGRSDWGIDTVLTYATAATGLPIYEHYVRTGKQHTLYGSLDDIREMVVECFEAVRDLASLPSPASRAHVVEPESEATIEVATRVGYDVEATLRLLTAPWTSGEIEAARLLPPPMAEALLANQDAPSFAFFTAEVWGGVLSELLHSYEPTPGWTGVLFRLWVARVLAYTTTTALGGHTAAMASLEAAVASYARG